MWKYNTIETTQSSVLYEVQRFCHSELPENADARSVTRFKCMNPFFSLGQDTSSSGSSAVTESSGNSSGGGGSIPVETEYKAGYLEVPSAAIESSLTARLTQRIRQWPRSTTVLCLHDCHPFDGMPFPLPESYDEKKGEWTISGEGVCCSLNCVRGYYDEHHDYQTPHKLMALDQFARQQFGVTEFVKSAPPRTRLRAFTGDLVHGLTIQQFRQHHVHVNLISRLPLAMITHAMVFAEEYGGHPTLGAPTPASVSATDAAMATGPSASVGAHSIGSHSLPSMFNAFLVDKSKGGGVAAAAAAATTGKPAKGGKKRKVVGQASAIEQIASETPKVHHHAASAVASSAMQQQPPPAQNNKKSIPSASVAHQNDSLLTMLSLQPFKSTRE